MGKIDLTRALRINTRTGELLGLKGAGFAWVKPVSSDSFTPAALFARGEKGTWTTPAGFFADTAGTQPATPGSGVARVTGQGASGWHAIQPDPARRPLLGRMPKGGRRNLFENTEDIHTFGQGNASAPRWRVENSLSVTSTTETLLGSKIYELTLTQGSGGIIRQTVSVENSANTTFCVSFYVKAQGVDRVSISGLSGNFTVPRATTFNLSTLSVSEPDFASLEGVGEDWYRLSFTRKALAESGSSVPMIFTFNYPSEWSGPNHPKCFFAGLQVEIVAAEGPGQATAVQQVRSRLDVTENGVPSRTYLQFDLADDQLVVETPTNGWYDIVLFGRATSRIARDVRIPPGGDLEVGPKTLTGAPENLLSGLGGLVGWVAIDRALAGSEIEALNTYYAALGAAPALADASPERNPDADPAEGALLTTENALFLTADGETFTVSQ